LWSEEKTETVPAKYEYMADKRVCIVVRADMETLVTYPQVQMELADNIRLALEAHVASLSTVDPRRVVDFQRSEPDWELSDPAAIGRRFGADRVLEVDLSQYTTREPDSPHLHRGYISALISVYNAQYTDRGPVFTETVQTVYPERSMGEWGASDSAIRRATMEAFAQDVAGLFYDRQVKAR
jgi:hypothetical protein